MTRANINTALPNLMCCIGARGYSYVHGQEKGLTCNPTLLEYLSRAYKIICNWYPEDYVIQDEKLSYFVYGVTTTIFTSTITNQSGTVLYSGSTNITAIVAGINASATGFTAKNIDGLLWIFAPTAGYKGMSLTLSGAGSANYVAKTAYFQGGCEEKIANAPCLTEQQAENIFELLKKNCDVCLPNTSNTIEGL